MNIQASQIMKNVFGKGEKDKISSIFDKLSGTVNPATDTQSQSDSFGNVGIFRSNRRVK